MRSLTKPNPEFDYDPDVEIAALRDYVATKPGRAIPSAGVPGHVLLATWNIANLGVHKRRPPDLKVIAELLSWFEVTAVQEVADNLDDLRQVVANLPDHFAFIVNDKAGNDERSAYVYDTRRVKLGEKIGEIVIVDSDRTYITLPGIEAVFSGFNRNPYIASFRIEGIDIVTVNAHLYYGPTGSAAERQLAMEKRQLEAYAIGRWCDLRRDDKHRYSDKILALGDFNLPEKKPGDPVFDALTNRGLRLPEHTSRVPGSNLAGDHEYDQVAFVPGLKNNIVDFNVFDFDGTVFADIWDPAKPGYWRTCVKYYLSDHRPFWAQLRL